MTSRILIFSFLFISFSACHLKSPSLKEGQIQLTIKEPDPEKKEILKMMGQRYEADIEITSKTQNTHYTLFVATATDTKDKNVEIEYFKTFSGCIYTNTNWDPKTGDFYEKDALEETHQFQLVYDNRLNKALGNKNIYFSLRNTDLETMGFEGNIISTDYLQNSTELFSDTQIIPISRGFFTKEGVEPQKGTEGYSPLVMFPYMIGMISYDCTKHDLQKMFESEDFAYFVKWSSVRGKKPEERHIFDIDQFLKTENLSMN